MGERGRMPDFVIIGALKSATTSLYRWLDEQDEIFVPHSKESRFFADLWSRGPDWYRGLFADAADHQLLGEASVSYTNPMFAARAAERMANMIPNAQLIYVVRHPVERIRSQYRHEVQRRREPRSLLEALQEPGNPYIGHSLYHACLRPYADRFPRDQILVVRFEDLVRPPALGWSAVLRSLSLTERPLPGTSFNVSDEKAQWSRVMSWAKRNGFISLRTISKLPQPIRRVGRTFAHGSQSYETRLEASRVPIPGEVLTPVWDDVARLEGWLGASLWPREGAAQAKASP